MSSEKSKLAEIGLSGVERGELKHKTTPTTLYKDFAEVIRNTLCQEEM
jgi:hypothetical protein